MTIAEAESLVQQGHFPAGSMLPKIEAAIDFARSSIRPGVQAIITSSDKLVEALEGKVGTRVVADTEPNGTSLQA